MGWLLQKRKPRADERRLVRKAQFYEAWIYKVGLAELGLPIGLQSRLGYFSNSAFSIIFIPFFSTTLPLRVTV
jgi:hypothetical protein